MMAFGSIDGVLGRKEFATPRRDLEADTPGSGGSVLFSSYKKPQESPASRHSPEDTGKKMFLSLDIGADGKAVIVPGARCLAGTTCRSAETEAKPEAQPEPKPQEEEDSNTKARVLNILRQMRNNNKKKNKSSSSSTKSNKVTKSSQTVSNVSTTTPKKLALPPTKELMKDNSKMSNGSKLPVLLVTASPSPSTPKPAPILPNDCNITPGYNLIDQALLSKPGSKFASPMVNFSPKSRLVPRMSISSEKRMKPPMSPRAFAETTNIANNPNHNSLDFLMGNELDSSWTDLYFNSSRRSSVQYAATGGAAGTSGAGAGAGVGSPNWWKYDNNITLSPLRNLDNIQNTNTNTHTNNHNSAQNSIISSPVFVRHDDATDENQIMRINQHSKDIYRQHNQSLLQRLTTSNQLHASHQADPVNTINMSHIYRSLHNDKEQSAGIAANDNVEEDASSALKTLIK